MLAQFEIADEALQPADCHRLTPLRQNAVRLALRFLGAHAAADGGQVILLLHRPDRSGHIAIAQRLNELRNEHADRAAVDAARLGALQAALGLLLGQLPGVAQGDLVEVGGARLRLLRRHLVARDRHALTIGKLRHKLTSAGDARR